MALITSTSPARAGTRRIWLTGISMALIWVPRTPISERLAVTVAPESISGENVSPTWITVSRVSRNSFTTVS